MRGANVAGDVDCQIGMRDGVVVVARQRMQERTGSIERRQREKYQRCAKPPSVEHN